jgi:transketolase
LNLFLVHDCPHLPRHFGLLFAPPGIEVTTGPLGQGFANAVGLAIASSHLSAVYNKGEFSLIDNFTYVIMGDGCAMEGVVAEAASLAGHLRLGRLIVLYDDNKITIDGSTNLAFTENVLARFEAYGWHTLVVEKGDTDLQAIDNAINEAKKETTRPSLIAVRTTIGYLSTKQGTHSVHGSPLTAPDLQQVKKACGLDPNSAFQVPSDVAAEFANAGISGRVQHDRWRALWATYEKAHPQEAAEFARRMKGELPAGCFDGLPVFSPDTHKPNATRELSGEILNVLAKRLPELVGGCADLSPSTKTELACSFDYQFNSPAGRHIRFGVREHGRILT